MYLSLGVKLRNLAQHQADLNNNKGMVIFGCIQIEHPNALGRKLLLQHGQRDVDLCLVEEAPHLLRKEIILIETHIHPTIIQYEDEGV